MPNFRNDQHMVYDLVTHKYYLTIDGYEESSGEALTSDHGLEFQQADRMLKRVTNIVYQYIYTWAKNPYRTEYELSLPKYRDCIRDALVAMMTGLLANKTDVSLFFSPNGAQRFKFTDTVTPEVKMILMNGGVLTRAELYRVEEFDKNRGVDY